MAWGLPVVVANTGGLPELVEDGVTGLVVPSGDISAFSKAVCRLLKDERLRKQMGNAARDRVRREFCVEHSANLSLDLYQRVIDGGGRLISRSF